MSSKRMGQARFETLAKSLNKRDGGIPIPVAEMNPAQWHTFFDDFHTPSISTAAAVTAAATAGHASRWDATIAAGGSVLLDIARVGGQVKLLTDTDDDDVINMQAIGSGFKLASEKKLWFEARIQLAEVATSGFFVGLASASGAADASVLVEFDDCMGFTMVDGSAATTLNHVLAKGSDQTLATTGKTMSTSMMTLSIYWDGTNFFYYQDGTLVTSPANTYTPDDVVIFPTIEFITRNAAAEFMHCDYIRVVQER